MDPMYRIVAVIGRFWLWFFFKSIQVRHPERVPARGPVLLTINHPNNLIDTLVVGGVIGRQVHFLATASLFRPPLLARFLRALGVIPVYRREDDAAQAARNTEAFEACFQTLDRGGLIAIYPEGTTHAEPRVQRIKTGAARIALEAEARREGQLGLTLLPVGLNFEARKSFGGRVLVSFGDPIAVTAYLATYRHEPFRAVDELTTVIQGAMEAQVIHVERIDHTALVREIEALYRDELEQQLREERGLAGGQIDPFRLSRSIAAAVQHFTARDPARVERIAHRIEDYRARLAAHRLRDDAVQRRAGRGGESRAGGRESQSGRGRESGPIIARTGRAMLGTPLFVYGGILNALPYLIPRWLARRLARKETDYATTRLLASIVAFPLFWGLETWIVRRLAGPVIAVAFALSLPASGVIAYRYLGGLLRLRHALRFRVLALTHPWAARRLTEERRALLTELNEARTTYLRETRVGTEAET
jgi:glycerol-3-phosphate O-acyltransferase / dihydroxyacetone phosphate acyltransferase